MPTQQKMLSMALWIALSLSSVAMNLEQLGRNMEMVGSADVIFTRAVDVIDANIASYLFLCMRRTFAAQHVQ